jgi:putative nucleotidyltransferase with HDIG domain
MRELESPDASTKAIGEIIARDIGMTATILKLVNSSFFGLARQITNPAEAVGLLGLDVIQGLAVSSHVFAALNVKNVLGFSFEDLWVHCLNAAGIAKYIAQSEGWSKELVDVSFLGGLLHDVGKLVLASVAGDQYNQTLDKVRVNDDLIWRAEKSVLGTTHAEVGAYLLGLWGMPDAVVGAIAFHHYPSQSPDPGLPLLAVHAANFIEHECRIIHEHYCKREVDGEFLRRSNVEGKLAGWLKRCESLLQSGEQS